ncbi:MAG TPA: helix-turn-helix domain-containing protein [Caulobacteraceae bacterium]|nr:helix-turn-helix domain-containing protein [Caulobacteraceae bacterium]
MLRSDDTPRPPQLDYDAWIASLREFGARHHPVANEPKSFTGWLRPFNVCGLVGLDVGCNAEQIERTVQDTRFDGREHYYALIPVAGHTTMSQNDQTGQLAMGDVAIVDSARPVTCLLPHTGAQWLSLQLPRRSLASHLGFEPLGGIRGRDGTAAGRLLHHIVLDALGGDGLSSPRADSYMQLAVYDLLGALFAPSDQEQGSRSTDKLFARVCGVMRERFAEPDFGPFDVAVETGISLRYVQKLFTERGTTCTQFLYSLRLDRAAQLLRRRAHLGNAQPLSEIAYACGYSDYSHFARNFRRRFGLTPGALAARQGQLARGASPPY